MPRVDLTYPPRLLSAPQAARYIGISETTLRTLGLPRRILGTRRLYDRYDLDAFADGLEVEDSAVDQLQRDQAECDRLFGIVG
ncbi:hypothetical protein SY26_09500 [Paracoccus sp. 228]|nr:hypothetical protein SY26_09500 [Paracoccus sp. 228]